jgi:glycosyltransferase involved in cell wall biosynthesis
MKITLLTQYFPPEVGAPQNRLFELATRLQKKGANIQILTAMPNYPKMQIFKGYRGRCYRYENMENMQVHRAAIFVTKGKSLIARLLNYFSFVFSSIIVGFIKLKKSDIILCESPPLFLGISAWVLCKLKGAKLVFNVSDLWPESAEKLGLVSNKFSLKLAAKLEEFLYENSTIICGQTQGIVQNIKTRFPEKKVIWIPNGVDPTLFENKKEIIGTWRQLMNFKESDFVLLYAGIMGYAQGLDVITDVAEQLLPEKDIKFVFLGNGPEKKRLQKLVSEKGLNNIVFQDFVLKSEMPVILQDINASIVPLKKLDLFLGAIPSKIFECLASEKPILLGVDGEAKELFINRGNSGLFFEPEDVDDLKASILKLKEDKELCLTLGGNGKQYVVENFNRDTIADKLWSAINELI